MATNSIDLTTQYQNYTDEMFSQESKRSLLTNNDFNWMGAHAVKVYKISTAPMNDYARNGSGMQRYGTPEDLSATTQLMTLSKDRSFTYIIDKMDNNETLSQLAVASSLARQEREVVIPEIDTYVYGVMAENAGTKPEAIELTADNIYTEILKATTVMDDAMVPETGRVLLVTPSTYELMKKCTDIVLDTDIAQEIRNKGVLGMLDGAKVVKIASSRLPEDFGFMMAHPCATVAPVKLETYKAHTDPPGISGHLMEGRFVYDAFVLENKAKAIYYQAKA